MKIIKFKDVTRTYVTGDHVQNALSDVNLEIDEGKFVVILGPSGAGKSTFLNLLGGLDNPTSGQIVVDDTDISTLTSDGLADYRAAKVGFVFQAYNLIPTLTVLENISLVDEMLGSGGFNHSGSGEKRQSESDEKNQSPRPVN